MSADDSLYDTLGDDKGGEGGPNVHMLLKIVILGVIGFVSVIGNLITLGTLIVYGKSLRIAIYVVIGGLALADIIVVVMNVPEEIITQADKGELLSDSWCKAYGFLTNSCQYIAAFHLVFLSVLRGVLLTDRANHGPTVIKALITCAVLWVVALCANIPMVGSSILHSFMKKCVTQSGSSKNSDVGIDQDKNTNGEELYIILSALFMYFLPLLLIIIIYLLTGYLSKRFFEESYSRRERRMSKMISCLIVTFALCRLPYRMVSLLWFYQVKYTDVMEALYQEDTQKFKIWIHIREYVAILSMLDMALRPIIYATMSREFGIVFDRVINCTDCKKSDDDEVPSARLHRRGEEIQEELRTPLHRHHSNIEVPVDEQLEEIC